MFIIGGVRLLILKIKIKNFYRKLFKNVIFNYNYDLTKYKKLFSIKPNEIIEMEKLIYNETPSNYIKIFSKKLLNTSNYSQINLTLHYHKYIVYFYLNKKILFEKSKIELTSDKLNKLFKFRKRNFLKKYIFKDTVKLESIIKLYENKEYFKVYNILKKNIVKMM